MLQRSHFHLGVNKKMLKTQFLGAKIHLFHKRSSLRSQTFLSSRTLLLAYSKLVWTPCTMYKVLKTPPQIQVKQHFTSSICGFRSWPNSEFHCCVLSNILKCLLEPKKWEILLLSSPLPRIGSKFAAFTNGRQWIRTGQ